MLCHILLLIWLKFPILQSHDMITTYHRYSRDRAYQYQAQCAAESGYIYLYTTPTNLLPAPANFSIQNVTASLKPSYKFPLLQSSSIYMHQLPNNQAFILAQTPHHHMSVIVCEYNPSTKKAGQIIFTSF